MFFIKRRRFVNSKEGRTTQRSRNFRIQILLVNNVDTKLDFASDSEWKKMYISERSKRPKEPEAKEKAEKSYSPGNFLLSI